MNENRLFVGNLSYQTVQPDLEEYFSQAGVVTSVNLMLDKVTGKSRGFAFVEYATAEEASKAVEQFHNKEFQGRALTVNIARPREERAPRWSGAASRSERTRAAAGGGSPRARCRSTSSITSSATRSIEDRSA
jgi:cold-inducible RNA-binding protein